MFDDDDSDGRTDRFEGGARPLVNKARRSLTVSYALDHRLRARGHLLVRVAQADQTTGERVGPQGAP